MELQKAIEARRSVRSFTDRKLTKNEIDELLRAATLAPSACNMQSWYFYVLVDEAERSKLKGICADWIATAPVVFIVCTDDEEITGRFGERGKKFPMQDTSLAIENMLLKATEMGFGGCMIGAYKQSICAETFNIPKKHQIVALLPIGEPAQEIPPRDRKPIAEVSSYIGALPEEGETKPSAEPQNKPFELKHAYLADAVFDDLGLPNASFNNIFLGNAKFNDINLSGAQFTDINLSGATYGGLNMTGSKFKCVELNNAVFGNCGGHDDGSYCVEMKQSSFDGVDMSDSAFNNVKMDCAAFSNVKLNDAAFSNVKLNDAAFIGTDLSGAVFGDPDVDPDEDDEETAVNFSGAKFGGVNMASAAFDNADMTKAQLNHCNMVHAVLTDISMAEAKLYDIDLDGGDLSGVNMVSARIQCSNLYGATVKNCCFENTALENCDIKGMTIDGVNIAEAIEAYKRAKDE